MTEDRLVRAFRTLNEPLEPDPAFADRLLARLVTDLDLGPHTQPTGLRARLRRSLRSDGRSAFFDGRLVPVLIVVGVLGMLTVGVVVGTRPSPDPVQLAVPSADAPAVTPSTGPSALELVALAREAWANPPAVTFGIDDQLGHTKVMSDGSGTWWSHSPDQAADAYMLYDGQRVAGWDPLTRLWWVHPLADGGPPYPFNDEFTLVEVTYPDGAKIAPIPCDDAVSLGQEAVAGRPADRVRCPGAGIEYWFDRATHLTLRTDVEKGSRFWNGRGAVETLAVSSFEPVASPDPAAFDWEGPGDTGPRAGAIASTNLVVGERPPAWTGSKVDGAPFSVADLDGPTVLLFSDYSVEPSWEEVTTAAKRNPGVSFVAVLLNEQGSLAGYLDRHPIRGTAIADPDLGLWSAWGLEQYPTLVLLDRKGRVADVVTASLTADQLDATFTALVAGDPVPVFTDQPELPTASPSPDGAATATPLPWCDLATCLEPGTPVGDWSAEAVAGGILGRAETLGAPLVAWFGPGRCDGECPAWVYAALGAFGDIATDYAGRASVVMVVSDETRAGDTARLLEKARATFPAVYDWDGAVAKAFGASSGFVVLDADGRVVGQTVAPMPDGSVRDLLDSALAGGSTPAP